MKNALFSDTYENPWIDLLPPMQMQVCAIIRVRTLQPAQQIMLYPIPGKPYKFLPTEIRQNFYRHFILKTK